MTDSKKSIKVYVRLAGDGNDATTREISFRLPDDISKKDILKEGFAIDGNSALIAVAPYLDEQDGRVVPLADALHDQEVDIVNFLESKGYDVQFE